MALDLHILSQLASAINADMDASGKGCVPLCMENAGGNANSSITAHAEVLEEAVTEGAVRVELRALETHITL